LALFFLTSILSLNGNCPISGSDAQTKDNGHAVCIRNPVFRPGAAPCQEILTRPEDTTEIAQHSLPISGFPAAGDSDS
jgi:hypothetical protein